MRFLYLILLLVLLTIVVFLVAGLAFMYEFGIRIAFYKEWCIKNEKILNTYPYSHKFNKEFSHQRWLAIWGWLCLIFGVSCLIYVFHLTSQMYDRDIFNYMTAIIIFCLGFFFAYRGIKKGLRKYDKINNSDSSHYPPLCD